MSRMSISELLIEAFNHEKLIEVDQDNTLPPISDQEFISLLDKNIVFYTSSYLAQRAAILEEFAGAKCLPPRIINHCLFTDLLFDFLEKRAFLEATSFKSVLPLKPLILKTMLLDGEFSHSPQHYLRSLLDELLGLIIGWDAQSKREALILDIEKVFHLLASSYQSGMNTNIELEAAVSDLERSNNSAKLQSRKSIEQEKRFIEKNKYFHQADQYLDQSLRGKELAKDFLRFLHTVWRECIAHYLCDYGDQSVEWQQLQNFTQDTIRLYQNLEGNSPGNRLAFLPTVKPNIEKFLPRRLLDRAHNNLKDIEKLNLSILNQEALSTVPAPMLLEENFKLVAAIDDSIVKAALTLPSDQWLLIVGEDDLQFRAKIAHYFEETQHFLLVNLLGFKVASKSLKGLGYDLMSKKTLLLDSEGLFNKVFAKTLEVFLKRYQLARRQKTEKLFEEQAEQEKQIETRKKRVAEERERIRKELALEYALAESEALRKNTEEKRLQAIEKAKVEAEALQRQQEAIKQKYAREAEKLRAMNSELERKLQEESSTNKQHEIKKIVSSLAIGDWLSMKNRLGEKTLGKVAIIYASTGKYIFVDKTGIKIGEYTQAALTEMLATGEAEFVETETSFEKSMEEVIKSFRGS